MIVCYCKIGRALVKQNKQRKHLGSVAVAHQHNRDRRIFLVCLCTVLCFIVGRLLISVWRIWIIAGKYSFPVKYVWVHTAGYALFVAWTHSANPLIYGILDKDMFRILKLCGKKDKKQKNWPCLKFETQVINKDDFSRMLKTIVLQNLDFFLLLFKLYKKRNQMDECACSNLWLNMQILLAICRLVNCYCRVSINSSIDFHQCINFL